MFWTYPVPWFFSFSVPGFFSTFHGHYWLSIRDAVDVRWTIPDEQSVSLSNVTRWTLPDEQSVSHSNVTRWTTPCQNLVSFLIPGRCWERHVSYLLHASVFKFRIWVFIITTSTHSPCLIRSLWRKLTQAGYHGLAEHCFQSNKREERLVPMLYGRFPADFRPEDIFRTKSVEIWEQIVIDWFMICVSRDTLRRFREVSKRVSGHAPKI